MNKILEYEHYPTILEIIKYIESCEGKHTQQALFSTYHNALTQICFDCEKVRSNIGR